MQADPLQQLRDVHLPADPGLWPPAAGWWLLTLIAGALLVWVVLKIRRHIARQQPVRLAKQHLENLTQACQSGQLSHLDYAHQCNEVLKRLLVRSLQQPQFAASSGAQWLAQLDSISNTDFFREGAGRILGDQRFQANAQCDPAALHEGLLQLVNAIKPGSLQHD